MKRSEADYVAGYGTNVRMFRFDEDELVCWGGPETPFGYQTQGPGGPRTGGSRRYILTPQQIRDFKDAEDKTWWVLENAEELTRTY